MATTPRERLEREQTTIESMADDGTISPDTRDALLKWTIALDEAKVRHKYRDEDGQVQTYAPRTIDGYLRCMKICAREGLDVLGATASEFNDFMDMMHDDQEKSKTTLARYQCAAKTFYRYHDEIGLVPDDIHVYKERSTARHDEYDMFTGDDVDALRRACGEGAWPVRNRALLELLIFTGQRIGALLTLRIKDVELNPKNDRNSYIYLNDDYAGENGGLKGALRRGRKRPMFGARKYVRDWIDYHPQGDDPDAWLFIGNPSNPRTADDDHWAPSSAFKVLRNIASTAGVDKPVNPHNFRHYCATVLYRDYDLDRDTIRMLFGHAEDSTALENVYSHLFDDDYIKKAETKMGYRDDEEDTSPFTPENCPTCGELLKDHWRQCPSCEEVFGPTDDFEDSVDNVRERAIDAAIESQDPDKIEAYQAIIEAVDDPVALAEHLAKLDGS